MGAKGEGFCRYLWLWGLTVPTPTAFPTRTPAGEPGCPCHDVREKACDFRDPFLAERHSD